MSEIKPEVFGVTRVTCCGCGDVFMSQVFKESDGKGKTTFTYSVRCEKCKDAVIKMPENKFYSGEFGIPYEVTK